MSDAQKLIAQVISEHTCGSSLYEDRDSFFYRCRCGWRISVMTGAVPHTEHLAGEVDKALGHLRRLQGHGQLLPGGILTPTYGRAESKSYTQWVSGWTPQETP